MRKLLVVDDEPIILHSFRRVFAAPGTAVVTAGTAAEARGRLAADDPDVVVLDVKLPDGSGLDLLREMSAADRRRPVVMITAHGTAETAIEAMKRGAFDYVLKPLDLDRLTGLLDRAFDAARLMRTPAALPDEPVGDRIIGRSPAVHEMCKLIGRVAQQDVDVLILGESGTGKELVARAIYQHSKRAGEPFLAINCAAIPEALVESELFGHERGAFTGADRQRVGKFEQCDGGTVLLDEIGDMPPPVQAKVLRVLQDRTFQRVGGADTLTARVRVLAATNRDLGRAVADRAFRGDLYYRLQAVTIAVPPLRDRVGDIPELAHHFLYRFGRDLGADVRGFDPEVMDRFQQYGWPGNVRELQGVVKAALLRTAGQVVRVEALPPAISAGTAAARPGLDEVIGEYLRDGRNDVYGRVVRLVERELIERALAHANGHLSRTSELLGINRTTLRTRMRELGLATDRRDPAVPG